MHRPAADASPAGGIPSVSPLTRVVDTSASRETFVVMMRTIATVAATAAVLLVSTRLAEQPRLRAISRWAESR